MIGVIRAEWIKLRTVTMNWVLGTIAVAFPLIVTLLTAYFRGDDTGFSLFTSDDLASVLTGTSVVSALMCGVIAAASITSEYGFGTIRPTFAATPKRHTVIVAKGLVAIGAAVTMATFVQLVGWFVGSAIAEGRGSTIDLSLTPTAVPAMVGLVLLTAFMSLAGYALGMITRSTPAAVSILIVWPLIAEGLKAVRTCSNEGIKTNVTLCFSATQALLAAKAGATYISPFVGRLDDVSQDGMELIADIVEIYDNYNFDTEVLVASVRHPIHVLESAKLGAHVATCPLSVLLQLAKHPLTDLGLAKFLQDWEKVPK